MEETTQQKLSRSSSVVRERERAGLKFDECFIFEISQHRLLLHFSPPIKFSISRPSSMRCCSERYAASYNKLELTTYSHTYLTPDCPSMAWEWREFVSCDMRMRRYNNLITIFGKDFSGTWHSSNLFQKLLIDSGDLQTANKEEEWRKMSRWHVQ